MEEWHDLIRDTDSTDERNSKSAFVPQQQYTRRSRDIAAAPNMRRY
jgi:hypothetical protein